MTNGNIQNVENFKNSNHSVNCNLSIEVIRQYYPSNDITSGRMNKQELLQGCDSGLKQNLHYGFYNLIDRRSKLKPAVVAIAAVSFEKMPWNYDNDNQEVLILVVQDKLFKCNPFSFKIGDQLNQIDSTFIIQKNIDNIHYFKQNNCMLAIQSKDEIIYKYIVWNCELSDFSIEEKHDIVKDYLK